MGDYSSIPETKEHQKLVATTLGLICLQLKHRGETHDASKMVEPEVPYFDKYTPLLKTMKYGSEEYSKSLENLQVALKHHYGENSHHPEHFEDGIAGMNLFDLVEMFADWWAATHRTSSGDIMKSIDINEKKFKMDPQLVSIFKNTAKEFLKEK